MLLLILPIVQRLSKSLRPFLIMHKGQIYVFVKNYKMIKSNEQQVIFRYDGIEFIVSVATSGSYMRTCTHAHTAAQKHQHWSDQQIERDLLASSYAPYVPTHAQSIIHVHILAVPRLKCKISLIQYSFRSSSYFYLFIFLLLFADHFFLHNV